MHLGRWKEEEGAQGVQSISRSGNKRPIDRERRRISAPALTRPARAWPPPGATSTVVSSSCPRRSFPDRPASPAPHGAEADTEGEGARVGRPGLSAVRWELGGLHPPGLVSPEREGCECGAGGERVSRWRWGERDRVMAGKGEGRRAYTEGFRREGALIPFLRLCFHGQLRASLEKPLFLDWLGKYLIIEECLAAHSHAFPITFLCSVLAGKTLA